ncbi:MAG: hypothetical protein HY901_28280 [Deltaproteobacteria bacterium]|nr:hypothetical protein [Deltaproteobacteria bacterium]
MREVEGRKLSNAGQPMDGAQVPTDHIEPGDPPRIRDMSAPHLEESSAPGAQELEEVLEHTGEQSYLPPGRGPGQRGGPALRAEGESGPVLRSREELGDFDD